MCVPNRRHSIYCILPPNILINIAKRGTAEQRDAVLDLGIGIAGVCVEFTSFPASISARRLRVDEASSSSDAPWPTRCLCR